MPASVHRYRASRPWSVGVLAAAAATGAVLMTGSLSSAFGPEESWLGPRIRQSVQTARAGMGMEAHAAPGRRVAGAKAPGAVAPAGDWQVQVGAFRNPQAAHAHLQALASEVPGLADRRANLAVHGRVTRARMAGMADEASAVDLCSLVSATGRECFVVRPGG